MIKTPLADILNRQRRQRNNSPYLSSCSSSKRQSVVVSSNSQYSTDNAPAFPNKRPDEKTIQELYLLFKRQGFENIHGLVKFLEQNRNEPPRKSASPILRSQPVSHQETMDRNKVTLMLNEAKQGLNQLESKINNFSSKQDNNKNNILKYKHLLTEDDENHEYLYERPPPMDYRLQYQKLQNENQQLIKRIEVLEESNIQRDKLIQNLSEQISQIKQKMAEPANHQSPKPSRSDSEQTFTLNVCNSDVRQDCIQIKDLIHTQSQQIKRI